MRIDMTLSRELQAVLFAMKSLDRTIAKVARQQTKRVAAPEWTRAISRRASTALERRFMVSTATVAVSNTNVRVASANKGRPLSGGMNPKTDWPAVEFGVNNPEAKTTYPTRSRKGKRYQVTRRASRAMPRRIPKGRVFYPAAAEMIPRLASLWVQTVVRTIHNATEGKSE